MQFYRNLLTLVYRMNQKLGNEKHKQMKKGIQNEDFQLI